MKPAAQLSWLAETLRACPHASLKFNDDADAEDALGLVPLGFSLRIDGCEPLSVCAGTLPELIDLAAKTLNQRG